MAPLFPIDGGAPLRVARAPALMPTATPTAVEQRRGHEAGLADLLPLLACPHCGQQERPLAARTNRLLCPGCDTEFPTFRSGGTEMPWLFSDPQASLLDWKARYNGFVHENASEQQRLANALEDPKLGDLARERIGKLLQARKRHRDQVDDLLQPLGLPAIRPGEHSRPLDCVHARLPKNQGLMSYYANIFRDWAWNNGENEAMVRAVGSVLRQCDTDGLGKLLTVGAGACRLSYDLHRAWSPDLSVVVDINPLLLFLASRVAHGETIPLYEFPIAPLDTNSFAVLQNCVAPQALSASADGRFRLMFANAMQLPFKPRSFDALLTPWLIDILPESLSTFAPRMNQLLESGGVWMNTGSLAFFHQQESWRYSEEEALQVLEDSGFEILSVAREALPYLQSPVSAHGRVEKVLSFSARKISDVESAAPHEYLPHWLLDTGQAVPATPEFVVTSTDHLLRAQVLAAVDGERSVAEIGELVARQYGLSTEEATAAVKRIFVEVCESRL